MSRPDLTAVLLSMASVLATRATCVKLSVGCILTDFSGRILSAGYNGPASGRPHCSGWSKVNDPCRLHCQATHAESNAIISCHAHANEIYRCYTTWSPCVACCKQLVQTGCREIYFLNKSEEHDQAQDFWTRYTSEQRTWHHYETNGSRT
jgi:dCMP deaminase